MLLLQLKKIAAELCCHKFITVMSSLHHCHCVMTENKTKRTSSQQSRAIPCKENHKAIRK